MAVLVPQDWHPPRDHPMDSAPASPAVAINPAVPRQRSSPANDHHPGAMVAPPAQPSPPHPQQPYPYPVQQQQAGWSAPHSPQQFYGGPAFYQNQQPYALHAQQQMHPQNPYYDPANAQFAQWAYQQMMFNAQHAAHQIPHIGAQRPRQQQPGAQPGAAPSPDYFAMGQQGFNPFPSGTPPPHPSQLPNGYAPDHPPYQGFHPYRRPQRQGSSPQDAPADWRQQQPQQQQHGTFQPPYARSDAAGSSTSVNSGSSQSGHHGSPRPRTNSTQGSTSSHVHVKSTSSSGHSHGRGAAAPPPAQPAGSSSAPSRPHARTSSTSSSSSQSPAPSARSVPAPPAALRKPSPLSQGTFTATEKRMSRDDSDLQAMLEPIPNAPGVRSGGLKGRLRRALSLGAGATLHEEDEDDDVPPKSGARTPQVASGAGSVLADDTESTATVQKKKSRSLFNSRLNRSTDNISLSSTMSSASMVIRKLGSIGKLTRRNSLAGITSLFKDKKDKEDEEDRGGKKGKKKKGEKGAAVDPSISHATAEPDRSDWTASADLAGLSPAARLARQHTLKSNAEAAAKAKAEAEARAAAAAAAAAQENGSDANAVPSTWEKNTTTRQGEAAPNKLMSNRAFNENGMRVVVEDDSDSGSEDGLEGQHPHNYSMDGWDDDDDWGEAHEDEDVTIRQDFEGTTLDDGEMEPWAVNVRRSVEKARRPTKGILKTRPDGSAYDQDAILRPNPAFTRVRSNSYDSAPAHGHELGPLAHMPSSDPDHIDGLHKHGHGHGQGGSGANGHAAPAGGAFIPPLSFDGNGLTLDSPKDTSDASSVHSSVPEKSLFNHPNSSAPALSTMFSPNPPTLSQRSATAPTKRLAFASNLSVYDTFPATVYDRRSEPATWSRLTPALAQRIKEELNSYKMEEMEVHAASRVHTQFFV